MGLSISAKCCRNERLKIATTLKMPGCEDQFVAVHLHNDKRTTLKLKITAMQTLFRFPANHRPGNCTDHSKLRLYFIFSRTTFSQRNVNSQIFGFQICPNKFFFGVSHWRLIHYGIEIFLILKHAAVSVVYGIC